MISHFFSFFFSPFSFFPAVFQNSQTYQMPHGGSLALWSWLGSQWNHSSESKRQKRVHIKRVKLRRTLQGLHKERPQRVPPLSCGKASASQQYQQFMLNHVQLLVTPWTVACQAPLSMDSPGKNTGVGCHALLQRIFLTQGLNLCLLHWQADSLPLYHLRRARAFHKFQTASLIRKVTTFRKKKGKQSSKTKHLQFLLRATDNILSHILELFRRFLSARPPPGRRS